MKGLDLLFMYITLCVSISVVYDVVFSQILKLKISGNQMAAMVFFTLIIITCILSFIKVIVVNAVVNM
jgi:hypothetical protein